MAILFRNVNHGRIRELTVSAPDGVIIGVIGLKGSGKAALLKLAAGGEQPESGSVEGGASRRLIELGQPLNFAPVDVLVLDAALACQDPLVRERACFALERLRRAGSTILVASYDEPLLTRLCDEIWWLHEGKLAGKGDVRDVLPRYRHFVLEQLVAWGGTLSEPIDFTYRRGDGRAEIVALETLGSDGLSAAVLRSHQTATVRVVVRFLKPVAGPVIGIMIRTRVGLEVFGTNTELEGIQLGECKPGDEVKVEFQFACELCPGEYTLTAASHDRHGTPHDWLDDAIAFSVADERYTAGVANLRATVRAVKTPGE
jgi:lipopolysaccharide transport system ATP-binding protein